MLIANVKTFFWSWYHRCISCINVPIALTLVRILLVPIIVYCIMRYAWTAALFLFLGAALTDVIDGRVARILKQETFLGACLDPLADKILTLSVLIALCALHIVPYWVVIFFGLKEIFLIGGTALLWYLAGQRMIIPSLFGKAAMAIQLFFLLWMLCALQYKWVMGHGFFTHLLRLVVLFHGAALIDYVIWAGISYRSIGK